MFVGTIWGNTINFWEKITCTILAIVSPIKLLFHFINISILITEIQGLTIHHKRVAQIPGQAFVLVAHNNGVDTCVNLPGLLEEEAEMRLLAARGVFLEGNIVLEPGESAAL